MQITKNEFEQFSMLIYKHSGINLKDGKMGLVNARLGKILRKREIDSFGDYYKLVVGDETGQELKILLDAIATNQTYFFRENDHFVYLKEQILPELIRSREREKSIRIWSAGCSSGEEPYTISIVLKEHFPELSGWNITIQASDISTRMLTQAQNGVYQLKALDKVPYDLLSKYFQKGVGAWEGYFRVKKEIQKIVEFKRINLLEPFDRTRYFDIIFCRNVMIYFDFNTQKDIISRYYDRMNPGSYFIVGHSESLFKMETRFKYIKPTIYKKSI